MCLICAVFRSSPRLALWFAPLLTFASVACSSSDGPISPPTAGAGGTQTSGGSTGAAGASGAPGAAGGAGPATGGLGGAPAAGGGSTTAGSSGSSTAGTSAAGSGVGGSSAGAAGSASSGAGAPGTGGSGGTAGGPTGNAILTESFDGPALPSGWDNFIGYVKNGANPQGENLIAIDTSKKHGGAGSVHFHGGSTPTMLTRPLPANTNKLYVRVWIWVSRQLGNNKDGNHETLFGVRKTSGQADNEVRFGEIKGALGLNEVPSDALSLKPELWNMGPSIPKDQWVCLEAAFLGDKATHEFYAWADGTEVHKVTGPSQWHAPMPADFLTGKFGEFIIGWHSFSNFTADVWADDLVLSTERVGCN